MNSGNLQRAVDLARAHAPFLAMLADRESQLLENLEAALEDPLAAARSFEGEMGEARRLRLERRRLALLVALGDLSGRFDPDNWKPGAVSVPGGTFPLVPGSWGYRNLDLRLRKELRISGGNVGVTADLFNAFNHQNFGCTNGGVTPNCVVSDPRRLQVGAEYSFL